MKKRSWGDISILEYGKGLRNCPEEPTDEYRFRVFGTNGPIGWAKEPLRNEPGIVVGRKGAYRGIHFSPDPFFVIDTAYYLRLTDPNVDLKWAYYKLLTVDMNRVDVGAAIPTTNRESFYTIPVSIPEESQQKTIASILSSYDSLIENNRRRIQLLEQSARMLYKEWFVHLRFPGHEHVKIMKGVPEGWERKKIGDVAHIRKGKSITQAKAVEGDVPVVAGGLEPAYYHNEANAKGPAVTISASGANAGVVTAYHSDIWASDCSFISSEETNQVYYFYCLLKFLQQELFGLQKGAAQPHVYPRDIVTLDIIQPPGLLIEDFSDHVDPLFKQVKILTEQSNVLKKARDILLPKLMSGEVEV